MSHFITCILSHQFQQGTFIVLKSKYMIRLVPYCAGPNRTFSGVVTGGGGKCISGGGKDSPKAYLV